MDKSQRVRARSNYCAHAILRSNTRGIMKAVLRDVSIQSVYLLCNPVFNIDEKLNIEIVLLGRDSELTIKASARVTRKDSDGIAATFNKPLEWWPMFSLFPVYQLKP